MNILKIVTPPLALGVMAAASLLTSIAFGQPVPNLKPNIVLILVDDAALMDFGAFGGEAKTPHIDALAERGALFQQYRTSPLCAPTRAMLLTGMDNHLTGVATIPEVLPEEHKGQPGYSMSLEPNVLTIADRLRAAGYRTLMSGKWHLGETPEEMPQNHGFDRSLALAASGADNWEDKSFMPYYHDAPWFEDGTPIDLPEDFYSSEFIINKMIDYLDETEADKPFFAYLPFQAIHIPVQAPPEFTDKYKGVYDEGWHALRKARHQRAQKLGLIPEGVPLAPMPDTARNWDSLSDQDRALYAARMEVNAAMLDAMDFHIGRFVDHLKQAGTYENTVFVVTSDNGPEPSSGDSDWRLTLWMRFNGYHTGLDGLGDRGSWGFIGPEWANAAASPGDLFKFYATEGGIRAPLIIAGPGVDPMRVSSPAMVTDIAPTLLDWLGIGPAASPAKAMTGRSLLPVLSQETDSVYAPDDVRAIEVSGNSALYKGDHKITRSMPPVGDGKWRLYNLTTDPGETQDLSASDPDVLEDMLKSFDNYAARTGLLAMPDGYNSLEQIAANTQSRLADRYGPTIVVMTLALIALILAAVFGLRQWRRQKIQNAL
ncbi:MAG: arylsulfatase [Candidatus Phaeomarinobacter sp.]